MDTSRNSRLFSVVTVVGAGVVGRGWAYVFSAAGRTVQVYDVSQAGREKCKEHVHALVQADIAAGLLSEEEARQRESRVVLCGSLAEALAGSGYVQESVAENLEIKKSLYEEMDALAAPETILASSTSALNINDFSGHLPGARRCIMAHPFNPPYVLPAVEVLGSDKTSPEVIEKTMRFLRDIGQAPVLMKRFVPGFIGNRIQAAILRESFHLVKSGVADVAAVDALMSNALGLRYALFGNFGVNNTNADGGVRAYYHHLGDMYVALSKDLDSSPPDFSPEFVAELGRQVDAMEGGASPAELCRWRDKVIQGIRELKRKIPHPGGRE